MKEFILRQFPSFVKNSRRYVVILVLAQMAVIGLMLLANKNLHNVYSESIEDNVKLFMENYELRMKTQECEPAEQDENQNDVPQNGYIRV